MSDKSCENCASGPVCELRKAASHQLPVANQLTFANHPLFQIVGAPDDDPTGDKWLSQAVEMVNSLRREVISANSCAIANRCRFYLDIRRFTTEA